MTCRTARIRPPRSRSARAARALALGAALASAGSQGADPALLPQPLKDADYLHDGRPPAALTALGRDLFFDPILSGNRNIACGTCHDPAFGTGDGLALGIGEGGDGAGPERRAADPVTGRVPRNAPALWNVGAREQRVMFHDGRLEAFGGERPRFRIPSGAPLPGDVDSLLAAQAFFPVASALEMAGQRGENEIADALVRAGFSAAWEAIARRVAAVDGYARAFVRTFDDVVARSDIAYRHIADALAAFQTAAFRSDESPFDAVLRSRDPELLPPEARAGMTLFYGKAGCAECHSGALLTDHDFHPIGVPQIGPGKGHGRDPGYWESSGIMAFVEDEGRYRVTGAPEDLFAFRTPSLRNVTRTGPWGHSGAFDSLELMVRHHLDAIGSLESFRVKDVSLPPLERVMDQLGHATPTGYSELDERTLARFMRRDGFVHTSAPLRGRIAAANRLAPFVLSDVEIDRILAFLDVLTDPEAIERATSIPSEVPSGLPPQPRTPPEAIGNARHALARDDGA